jgi:uncharacterized membrane protein
MDTEALKSLLSDFDLTKFVPALDTVLGWIEMATRITVMVGPVLMLGLGLIYLLAPPKEANYRLGYRFWWSMASLDAWQFTHRLVGCILMPLGLILTIVMAIICNGFRGMEAMDMVWSAVKCLGWELGLALLSCLVVDVVVVIVFDQKGFRRRDIVE